LKKNIAVVTPPRTGTHFLVTSISKSLNIPEIMIEEYGHLNTDPYLNIEQIKSEIDIKNQFVIGLHTRKNVYSEKVLSNYNVITTDRNPIGQAVSILNFYLIRKSTLWCKELGGSEQVLYNGVPNSDNFIQYLKSKRFYDLRQISNDWNNGKNLLNIDKIMSGDKDELNKLNDLTEGEISLLPFSYSSNKYPDTVFNGTPDYWKTVVSKQTMSKVYEDFPGYDLETFCNSSKEGNEKFLNDLDLLKKRNKIEEKRAHV